MAELLPGLPPIVHGEDVMNFPMEYPVFRFLYWLLNPPGIGGIAIMLLIGGLVTTYLLMLRWVVKGARAEESDQYAFPTSSLIGHGESKEDYFIEEYD